MQADTISMAAGAALSLLFSYMPGLAQWFAALGEAEGDGGTRKRLVMLGMLAGVALGAFGLSCARLPLAAVEVECSRAGAWELCRALVAAIAANQGVYALSPKRSNRPPGVEGDDRTTGGGGYDG